MVRHKKFDVSSLRASAKKRDEQFEIHSLFQSSPLENTETKTKGLIGTLLSSIGDLMTQSICALTKEETESLNRIRLSDFGASMIPISAPTKLEMLISILLATARVILRRNLCTDKTVPTITTPYLADPPATQLAKNGSKSSGQTSFPTAT